MTRMPIYAKTAAGADEIVHRQHRLDARHRAALIMVDGKRTLDELRGQLSAFGDVAAMLALLAQLGLITAGDGPALPTGDAAAANDGEDWRSRRQHATRLLHEALGPDADMIAMKLERARSEDEMLPLLRRGVQLIGEVRGGPAAASFARSLGI